MKLVVFRILILTFIWVNCIPALCGPLLAMSALSALTGSDEKETPPAVVEQSPPPIQVQIVSFGRFIPSHNNKSSKEVPKSIDVHNEDDPSQTGSAISNGTKEFERGKQNGDVSTSRDQTLDTNLFSRLNGDGPIRRGLVNYLSSLGINSSMGIGRTSKSSTSNN